MDRRAFLQHAGSAAAAAAVAAPLAAAAPASTALFVDTNVSLYRWPTRRLWADDAGKLVAKLRRHGVSSAWTGNFEAALHTDMAGANARLADACARDGGGILRPFGSVNPTIPDWPEDLRRCHEVHRMPGLRLFPNYHGYTLDDPRFKELLERATERGLLVQIALSMEDDRSQNPVLQSAPVAVAPLPDVLAKLPGARVMLLNSFSRVIGGNHAMIRRLTEVSVAFELATLEGAAGVATLLNAVPGVRLTFGSHSPYYYFEAALLKLQESALSPGQLASVRHGWADSLLGPRPQSVPSPSTTRSDGRPAR
ncbi:MAG: amidohydrolase family protein [Opitutaceae bacterium]|nr:amidohydrolase family protein [Opitutaceae bacterium]